MQRYIVRYGGLGDRHQKNGINYTLDLNAGLTQVLIDGTNTYLYGNGRISQHATQTEYFLGDALGSVRQLANPAGAVTLTQSYAPYGETVSSVGSGMSMYQFTGDQRDENGLSYLRARYYAPQNGRFLSRDIWAGAYERPLSLNRWNYTEGNPVNFTDSSGLWKCKDPICYEPARDFDETFNKYFYLAWENSSQKLQDELQFIDINSPLRPLFGTEGFSQGLDLNLPMTDGFVFGMAFSANSLTESGLFGDWAWGIGSCGTIGIGIEIVYDFRHQERTVFAYPIAGETWVSVLSADVAAYTGNLWGFSESVRDYGGYFKSYGVSTGVPFLSLGDNAGVSMGASIGVPYNMDGTQALDGVFGTYVAASLGATFVPGAPGSATVLKSNYIEVPHTFLSYGISNESPFKDYVYHRKWAASFMGAEMNAISTMTHYNVSPAVTDALRWAYYK